jgi:SAM-dependent methyltransferase
LSKYAHIAEAPPREPVPRGDGRARPPSKFDHHENDYEALVARSIRFAGRDHSFFVASKARHLVSLISTYLGDPADQQVLDVGCGAGTTHPYLREVGALVGVDVAESLLQQGRRENPNVSYVAGNALELPFADGQFDAAFTITVLHHIAPLQWPRAVRELKRVARAGGLVVIFEHNPYNPLTRLAVNRCEFDDDAVLLTRRKTRSLMEGAGLEIVDQSYILLTPWRNAVASRLEGASRQLALGAQYYVAGRTRSQP